MRTALAALLLCLLNAPTYAADAPKPDPTPIKLTDGCKPDLTKLPTGDAQAILIIDATKKTTTSRLFTQNLQAVVKEITADCTADKLPALSTWLRSEEQTS